MKCPNCGYKNLPGADQCEQCLSSLTRDDVPQAESGVESVAEGASGGEPEAKG